MRSLAAVYRTISDAVGVGLCLLSLVGCSPKSGQPLAIDKASSEESRPRTDPSIGFQSGDGNGAFATNAITLRFHETKPDSASKFITEAMIEENTLVEEELRRSTSTLGLATFGEIDARAIEAIVSNIAGFVPTVSPCIVGHYSRYSVVIVVGEINGESHNVYLIRVPGGRWMHLKTQRMPAPLMTR